MTDLQDKMLELVLEIDEICQKHNIIYYLTGGSVLGAVRHGGFIPWDDDIDIMMTRQEFEKFQKACETDMADDREIISMMNTPCHTKVTIKYMNKTTSQFFRSQVLDYTGCGISLDIMILDPLPRDEAKKEQHIMEYIVFNELLTPFFMVNPYFHKCVPLYQKLYEEIKQAGKEKVMGELYRHLFVEEPEESDFYLYRWGQQLLIYDRNLLGQPRYMNFEGHMLPVPEKTIDFLRATYGDNWIYLPPEHQRETHVSNVSPTIAYRNWLKDIEPFLDRPKVLDDFIKRKEYNVAKVLPAHELTISSYKQIAIMKELEFESVPSYAYDFLVNMDDRELLDHVDSYLSTQLTSGFVKNQIYIEIPDDTLSCILNAMIRVGDYSKADKILKLRKKEEAPLTNELMRIGQTIDAIRKTVCYFEDRRLNADDVAALQEMKPELMSLIKENPRQVNLHRCILEFYTLCTDFCKEDIFSAIDTARKHYPEDLEIAFWSGCLYQQYGMNEQAIEMFEKARTTSNGVILYKLNELGFSETTSQGEEN